MELHTIQRITSPRAAVPFTHNFALNRHLLSASPDRAADLRPSRPSLPLFLSMMLLTGLTGCGPASSDNAPSVGPRASVSESPPASPAQEDKQISKPAGTPAADTPNSKTDRPNRLPTPLTPEMLDSVAKDLDSPYASIRLSALKHWEANGTTAPLDLVFDALQDENEAVREKATEIITQRFAAEQAQERN